ncbi:MAG: hypothetical protein QXQ40_02260 [Candidatus Aenigmatarchaeota archaeon]
MKGQWFIISAVIISGMLLTISTLLNGFFLFDYSSAIRLDEDFLFLNIERELNRTIQYSKSTEELERNIKYFIMFVESETARMGYYMEIRNLTHISQSGTTFLLSLVSSNMNITRVITLP